MPDVCEVLIVGGGVIGLSIARRLALDAVRVTVLDRQAPGREASWAGAGILPPTHLGPADDPLVAMTRETHALWPQLSEELVATTGIDNGFRRCGGVRLQHEPSQTSELSFRADHTQPSSERPEDWIACGASAQWLTAAELKTREPALHASDDCAIWLPDLCQVRNPWHLHALLADCRRLGVEIRPEVEVLNVSRTPTAVLGVQTTAGDLHSGCVVVASGAWSGLLLPAELRPVEIEPVRGQILLLRTETPLLHRVVECGNRYLVPREDGRLLIGSTEERVGYEKQTTTAGIAGLFNLAVGLVPDLASAKRELEWAGLRPHARGGLPYIGAVPDCQGLYLAAGHFRAGLHLSPLTAERMHKAILG
ncbi:MAG: glycine oxidase ThiO [Planctomycetaceae bacterium]